MILLFIDILALLVGWYGLAAYALSDLLEPDRRVRRGDKNAWALVIILGSFVGLVLYFAFGREDA